MALEQVTFPSGEKCSKILEWKVKPGSLVSKGRVLLHFVDDSGGGCSKVHKLKASKVGTVTTVVVHEGALIKPGDVLLEMESCSHPTVMRDLCAECGADLSNEKQTASVPMVHCVPELKVSLEQAQKLGRADEERLLIHRKLVLLVDLDQTLIHTTNDDIPPNLKDVHHFQLYGSGSPWYHTRLRPLTLKFLDNVSRLYELHICTFGARSYAHTIAKILDPDEKLFSHRILSRDECFDPNSKTANLKALFPCGDHMVCIIDDREDVWNFAPNLIAVKPYHFFQHTGDIHAPPGLDKHERDGSGYTQTDSRGDSDPINTSTTNKSKPDTEEEDIMNSSESIEMMALQDVDASIKEEIRPATENLSTSVASEEIDMECTGDNAEELKLIPSKVEVKTTKTVEDTIVETCTEVNKSDIQPRKEQITEPEKEALLSSSREVFKTTDTVEETIIAEKNQSDIQPEEGEVPESNTLPATLENKETSTGKKEDTTEKDANKEEISMMGEASTLRKGKSIKQDDKVTDNDCIDIPDPDDYLLYLQDILHRIHAAYYKLYDDEGKAPNMREVVPSVRRKVLTNQSLVFSGVVPTHVPLASSRSAQTARNLGARVTEQVVPGETTHLVAARPGTAKVNEARRAGTGIHLVSPEWLSCTADRWERAEERLFPLSRSSKRGIPENNSRMSTNSLAESLNPLLALSSEDLKSMDQEVEDIFNETDDESAMDRDADSEEDEEEEEEEEDGGEGTKLDALELLADLKTDEGSEDEKEQDVNIMKRSHDAMELEDFEGDLTDTPAMKLFKDADCTETPTSDAEEDLADSGDESELSKMGLALEREFLAD